MNNLTNMTFSGVFSSVCPRRTRVVLFLSLPVCFFIAMWFTGEDPITIIIHPPVALVGEQVTLSCQLTPKIPSNTSVLWYKEEKGRDTPLCSSSSLDGEVEQCQHEEQCRIEARWERKRLLLIIQKVQISDRGVYICAVSGNAVSQEAVAHLDVIAIGNKPALVKDQQEESSCRYTCNSKGWYPKPQVIWTTYGGGKKNVEIKTTVTWSETDLFVVQSIITVPCDDVDVKCVIMLIKEKINQTGSLNEMTLQKPSTEHTFTYESQMRGDCVNPKAISGIPQREHLSSLSKTSIPEEKYSIFAIESSDELRCGQPPPSDLTTNRKSHLQLTQQIENHNWLWILCLFCLIIVIIVELQAQGRAREDREKETLKKETEQLLAQKIAETQKKEIEGLLAQRRAEEDTEKETLKKEIEQLLAQRRAEEDAEKEALKKEIAALQKKNAQCQKQIEELQKQGGAKEDPEKAALQKENEEHPVQGRSGKDAEKETPKKENDREEELRAMIETLKKENESLRKKEREEELRAMIETLERRIETLEKETELLRVQRYIVDVTLDADTAHPRLQVSEDGKSVTDTGVIRKVHLQPVLTLSL
ncbi:uncharacterized protein LOC107325874 isoform X3 [Coturnix japonica]|uniref:uncharacterized protein LOC107325874 isoform X3 n=1 Tax=Coturnix japonica TaxID=93934 RepID=UPI0013A5C4F6|nr:uncharacterized protein LOC107325874 isoform X3 [Coturnix japonica]